MRPSRQFIVVLVCVFIASIGMLALILRSPVPPPAGNVGIDNAIREKEAELAKLQKRTPEEEARVAKERDILSATTATLDVRIPGVEITASGTQKVLRNEREEYQLTFPNNLLLARSVDSAELEFHDKETMCAGDPSCPPVIRIAMIGKNPAPLAIAEWLTREERAAGADIYSPREMLSINGVSVVKVTESLPEVFDGYYYYWAHGGKIYALRIARVDEQNYGAVINSLVLISQ